MHLVLIGTKPDIIKQTPLVLELRRRKQLVILGTTGQHYDKNLTNDAWQLAGLKPDFDLRVRGTLYDKVGQIVARFGHVVDKLTETGKIVIPYAHGDTTTAMAVSAAAYMNETPVVHVEAGLRSFTPRKEIFDAILKHFSFPLYKAALQDERNWEKGSLEPYPEQYNTRTVAPAAAFHAAPTAINKKNLLAEGFRQDRIAVVGNSVADSVLLALSGPSQIFKEYPVLKDGFVRFAIHRRENLGSRQRFGVIVSAVEQLIAKGEVVMLVLHHLTLMALKDYGHYEKLKKLAVRNANFIFEQKLLPYRDNVHALTKVKLNVTDSGSEQEEGNIMGFATATARFGSDRPETVWVGGNVIAPPISKGLFIAILEAQLQDLTLRKIPKLYGRNVVSKIADRIIKLSEREDLFQWEHERLGYSQFNEMRF